MSKVLKVIFILFISFIFCFSVVYATDVGENVTPINQDTTQNDMLDANTTSTSDTNTTLTSNTEATASNTSSTSSGGQETLTDGYSQQNLLGISSSSSGLNVNSIINILLIAVGVIIIFLAIAIFKSDRSHVVL